LEQVDIVVIGAGVVGLAIAERLSAARRGEIVLAEQHPLFGEETSSRNSEVIHAGMYYPTDSLKARLCVRGNHLLYQLCEQYQIPHRKCGKLIVGTHPEEIQHIEELYRQGLANGVPGLELIDQSRIHQLEPEVTAQVALYSPATGLLDAHQLMRFYEMQAEAHGVTIAYNSRVVAIARESAGYKLTIATPYDEEFDIGTKVVINAAGLHADKIATLAGIDPDHHNYRLHPCKGEYFNVANRHAGRLSHLIYPTPTAISLGIHTRLRLDGTLALGPNAFYVTELTYDVNPAHAPAFWESVHPFLPFIEPGDLSPEMAGIRAKLQGPGDKFRDFVIREESDRGLPGFINLIGIDSPGLTSAPAIAEMVTELF